MHNIFVSICPPHTYALESRHHRCRSQALMFLLWVCSSVIALAQGQIVFNNRVAYTVVAPIYNADPSNAKLAKQGNTALGKPSSTQSYPGLPISGSIFTAQLFGGPVSATPEALVAMVPSTTFRNGDGAGFIVPPKFALTVPGVDAGQPAKLVLRVWYNGGGTYTNWSQVAHDPTSLRGESLPFISQPLGGVLVEPPNLEGLQSFNLTQQIASSPNIMLMGQSQPISKGFQLSFQGRQGNHYEIQGTTNFSNWLDLGPATLSSNDWFQFLDDSTSNSTHHFYRIKAP